MILITGATGLIGGDWLRRLGATARVVALTRGVPRPLPGATEVFQADLAATSLGLPARLCTELKRSVTAILHCAADIRFTLSIDEARRANVQPVVNLLDFARECRRLEKFAHLSTVYVAGDRAGAFDEAPLKPGCFLSTYQQSKYEAECAVLAAMREVPAVIYRLSAVCGDSTGAVQQFNFVHRILRLARMNPFPAIPADPDARMDLIPSDWAAAALDHLQARAFQPGTIRHVCAGAVHSLTVRDLFEIADPKPRPTLVTRAEFERMAADWTGTPRHELWRVMSRFVPHLAIRQEFRNHATMAELESAGIALPPMRDCFRRVARSIR
jgi:long-chain acyl-CoA synthetase